MMKDQEEEEFITVRVQDPRIQDQSSWSPYVDYKIFLYTNSKAFTVKTSCVRRRYREFVWLRRRLQKNSGLVPLPELPGKKPFFQVNDSEGIERRRQGLQQFLENFLTAKKYVLGSYPPVTCSMIRRYRNKHGSVKQSSDSSIRILKQLLDRALFRIPSSVTSAMACWNSSIDSL
ncbi:sorting nexin-11-like isoform X2 [Cetorhinus maximus]